jgi:hypothetical protein
MSFTFSSVGRQISSSKYLEATNSQWSFLYKNTFNQQRQSMPRNLHQIAGLSDSILTLHIPTKIFLGEEIFRKPKIINYYENLYNKIYNKFL